MSTGNTKIPRYEQNAKNMKLDLTIRGRLDDDILDLLNETANCLASSFTDRISEISELFKDNLDWRVGGPASRNTLLSPLFYYFCSLHLIDKLTSSGTNISIVLVDSVAFRKIVEKYREKRGLSYQVQGPKNALPSAWLYMKSLKVLFGKWQLKQSQFQAAKSTSALRRPIPKEGLILIDVFISPGFILKDRYYDGLLETLSSEQKKKVFFVPTFVSMDADKFENAYKEVRESKRNFLIKEDLLKAIDLNFALAHIIRVHFLKLEEMEVLGVDFSELIKEEIFSYRMLDSSIEGILNYRFAKRLRGNSYKPSLVIDWWEGQPLDKGWNLGFNKFFPETLTKGYLGYAPRLLDLQLFPSDFEIKNGISPSKIITIGKAFSEEMKRMNPSIEVEHAPAFRFSHLWDDSITTSYDSKIFTILIALTIVLDESIEILDKVIVSMGKFSLNEVSFLVKPHPLSKMETIKKALTDKWPDELAITKLAVSEHIRNVDLLITGMSTVGLESIVLGIPVIVVQNHRGFLYAPIPDSAPRELWRTCRTPDEMTDAIRYYRNRTEDEVKIQHEIAEAIKGDYFEPVNREGVLKLLNLNQGQRS